MRTSAAWRFRRSELALDRNADQVAPFRPRTVVHPHVVEAEQFSESEIENRGAVAQSAIGDDVLVRCHSMRVHDGTQFLARSKALVGIQQVIEVQMARAGDSTVTHCADVRAGGGPHPFAPILLGRAPIQNQRATLPEHAQHLIAQYAHAFDPRNRRIGLYRTRRWFIGNESPPLFGPPKTRPIEHAYFFVAAIAEHPPCVYSELHALAIEHDRGVIADAGGSEAPRELLRRREVAHMRVPQHLFPFPGKTCGRSSPSACPPGPT